MSPQEYRRKLFKKLRAKLNWARAYKRRDLRRAKYWMRQADRVFRCEVCGAPGAVECRLPLTQVCQPPDELLCAAHTHRAGFCYGCGGFFAGIETFDIGNPSELCDECHHEMRVESGEFSEEDPTYVEEVP